MHIQREVHRGAQRGAHRDVHRDAHRDARICAVPLQQLPKAQDVKLEAQASSLSPGWLLDSAAGTCSIALRL